ncbi:hypothetical protein CUJ84_Chr001349 [Rhizobium leguminosarum]|uniref:Uncharacterized protein n=1 Tax=Rhizobium leguminosarum TaxID=384 RepID=A0A2K9Z0I8_RHILE|nr:hypothetical protein CUJ84_Chr001349 [Rhizobium leguminosarum]
MERLRPVCCRSLAALPVLLKMSVNFKRIDILIVEHADASPDPPQPLEGIRCRGRLWCRHRRCR